MATSAKYMLNNDDIRVLKRIFVTKSEFRRLEDRVSGVERELKLLRQDMDIRFELFEARMKEFILEQKKEIIRHMHDIMDPFLGEIVHGREERNIIGFRLRDHEDRIAFFEGKQRTLKT
jgi:hypothetical protein